MGVNNTGRTKITEQKEPSLGKLEIVKLEIVKLEILLSLGSFGCRVRARLNFREIKQLGEEKTSNPAVAMWPGLAS